MNEERYRYLAEGNAKQARKRVAADVLVRDPAGRVLLVDPGYKPQWDLPGGMAEANEPPTVAARRELREELALDIEIGRLLYLEWVPPHDPWDDQLAMIFDGGTLTGEQIGSLRIADGELKGFDFVSVSAAADLLRGYVHRRLTTAIQAQAAGRVAYLESTDKRLGES